MGGQCSRKRNAKSARWRKSISRTRKEFSSNPQGENLAEILETQGWMLTDGALSAAYEPQTQPWLLSLACPVGLTAALLQLCSYISQARRAAPNTSGETLRPQDCTLTPGLLQLRALERAQPLLLAWPPPPCGRLQLAPATTQAPIRNRRRQPSLNAPFQHCPVSPSQSNQNQK